MSSIDLVRSERATLCDLLEEVGPDRPTLSGWSTTHELAAHLVVRESRVDAAIGVLGGPLSAWTDKLHKDAASQPYDKLVRLIRNGPPIWSHFRLPWVDAQLNTPEFFIHTEDIRRAVPGWEPRKVEQDLSNFLWDRIKLSGRLFFNSAKGGVILQRTDNPDGELQVHRAKSGSPKVTVTGAATELAMVAYGRPETRVEMEGDDDAVAAFSRSMSAIPEATVEEALVEPLDQGS